MNRCIELAKKGTGFVSPNPLVGCVIVKRGKIIAEGRHKKFGAAHAERDAIDSALKKGVNLKGSVLYVNLEPCSHHGKTPPCAGLIAGSGISEVVIGIKDPYKSVNGKGIRILRKSGIKVTTGILEKECTDLNRFFLKHIRTGMPYVTIKAAQTLDGKIADTKYNSKWISSLSSRKFVHVMRSVYDAVLVGGNTVKYDNPSLTVRLANGRNPYRVVIDGKLSGSVNRNVYSDKECGRTILFTAKHSNARKIEALKKKGVKVFQLSGVNGILSVKTILKELGKLGINSLIIEGGSKTYSGFIKKGLIDEYLIFIAPRVMGGGINAFSEKVSFSGSKSISSYKSGSDILLNIK